ncbi:type I-G CRISPR-associated protein Csb2 [Acidipropionibacterium virtanenii]|uniref:CRISPR-associated protein Csb2 n=1 Tax=Acidipropionibacterium virtanenii TaxID=2057246 RepID=A0A344UR01_9ACTN|nr:type I-U CRISPR-associated protein Csb2 [Acidipropionibacterium virtanenii]AXE37699.1 hypothetical protein JS278_00506 [Acidipropionibacterium virtanenii]
MPPLTIRARFPLGMFQGHLEDGSPSRLPDTARLYSALINAAGNGTAADPIKGQLRISSESAAALNWLEHHPPTELMVPEYVPAYSSVTSYRDEGTLEKPPKSNAPRIKKSGRTVSTATALAGPVGWFWDEAPSHVHETIGRLCGDVSCLGESDTPVVLTIEPIETTHKLISEPSELHPRGISVRTPAPGRLDELERAWEREHPTKFPTKANDKARQTERTSGSPIPRAALQVLQYEVPTRPVSPDPWPFAFAIPVERALRPEEVVDWCVATHRMLVSRMGDSAPASVTGAFPRGVRNPANRVAIQYVPSSFMADRHGTGPSADEFSNGALMILLPAGLEPADQAQILRALDAPTLRVWMRTQSGSGQDLKLGSPSLIGLHDFWPEVRSGWRRTWRSARGLVPETRRQNDHPDLGRWGFEEAALLSLFHVFRDHLPDLPRRDYWAMVQAVTDKSLAVRVLSTHRISDSRVDRYVHKAPKAIGAVQPYSAEFELGHLVGNRALISLGQSRHLGGGLLVPVDTPEES